MGNDAEKISSSRRRGGSARSSASIPTTFPGWIRPRQGFQSGFPKCSASRPWSRSSVRNRRYPGFGNADNVTRPGASGNSSSGWERRFRSICGYSKPGGHMSHTTSSWRATFNSSDQETVNFPLGVRGIATTSFTISSTSSPSLWASPLRIRSMEESSREVRGMIWNSTTPAVRCTN